MRKWRSVYKYVSLKLGESLSLAVLAIWLTILFFFIHFTISHDCFTFALGAICAVGSIVEWYDTISITRKSIQEAKSKAGVDWKDWMRAMMILDQKNNLPDHPAVIAAQEAIQHFEQKAIAAREAKALAERLKREARETEYQRLLNQIEADKEKLRQANAERELLAHISDMKELVESHPELKEKIDLETLRASTCPIPAQQTETDPTQLPLVINNGGT